MPPTAQRGLHKSVSQTPGGDLRSGFLPTKKSPVSTLFPISRPLGRSRNAPNTNGSRLVIRPHPRLGRFPLALVLETEPPSGELEPRPRV